MSVVDVKVELNVNGVWTDTGDVRANLDFVVGTDIAASALSVAASAMSGRLRLSASESDLAWIGQAGIWTARISINNTKWVTCQAEISGNNVVGGVRHINMILHGTKAEELTSILDFPIFARSISDYVRRLGYPVEVADADADGPPVTDLSVGEGGSQAGRENGTRISLIEKLARWLGGSALQKRDESFVITGFEQNVTPKRIRGLPELEDYTTSPIVKSRRGSAIGWPNSHNVETYTQSAGTRTASWRTDVPEFSYDVGFIIEIDFRISNPDPSKYTPETLNSLGEIHGIRDLRLYDGRTFRTIQGSDLTPDFYYFSIDSFGDPDYQYIYVYAAMVTSVAVPSSTTPRGWNSLRLRYSHVSFEYEPVGDNFELSVLYGPSAEGQLMVLPKWGENDRRIAPERMRDLYQRSDYLRYDEVSVPLRNLTGSQINDLVSLDPGDLIEFDFPSRNVDGRIAAIRLTQGTGNEPAFLTFDVMHPSNAMPDTVPRIFLYGDSTTLGVWVAVRPPITNVDARWKKDSGNWTNLSMNTVFLKQSDARLPTTLSSGDKITVQSKADTQSWNDATEYVYEVP